ncbi:MAG: FG-GAP repeat domain-containing protein, partial [Nitrososphaerales archaeon]
INGSRISIYVNGTLDGKLETGPPWVAGSTRDITIGAYENALRGNAEWSNYYFGEIGEATVWEYAMVDMDIQEEFLRYLNQYTNSSTGITTFTLNDGVKSVDAIGISNSIEGKPDLPSEEVSDELRFNDYLTLNLNGIPIITPQESLVFHDNLILALNEEPETQVNATILSQTLAFSDSIYLKLNDTTYTYLEEGLLLTEDILLLLNNQTVSFSNSTSRLTHGTIEIGKIVNWTQTVMLNETDSLENILVELPADAQNIQIQKTDGNGTSTIIPDENLVIISAELESVENEYDIPRPKDINLDEIAKEHDVQNIVPLDYATLENLDEIKQKDKPTKAILINETKFDVNVTEGIIPQNDTPTEYTLKFQTPAPYAIENDYSTETKFQKNVTIAHDSTLHYTDVRSYTDIPEYLSLHNTQFKLFWMINDTKVDVTHDLRFNVTFADTDNNNAIDRMEWNVPQLSEQQFTIEGIIFITKAMHLDTNREFIEDVYPQVRVRDGNWTDPIPAQHYIRVEFEKSLNSTNDITIFAKSNSSGIVEVYEVNGTERIASFGPISADNKYRVLLTNLTSTQNTFDLKIVGGNVEFDYIVDPHLLIPYVFVEQTTRQTTTSTTYGDITGASIASGSFTAGKKYLLVFTALLDVNSASSVDGYIKAQHGSTDFAGSEMVVEPESTTTRTTYTWFTVWTAVASEGVKLQFRSGTSGTTVGADQITIFAMDLSTNLRENRDWYYNSNSVATNIPFAWTTTNNAQITFTPIEANHDWLVMGTSRADTDAGASNQIENRIRRSGEKAATLEMISQERQDGTNDRFIETLFNVTKLGAASNTFTQENRVRLGSAENVEQRTHNQIFALDLNRFTNHAFVYNDAETGQLSTTDYVTQVQTLSFTPTESDNAWIMGGFIADDNANDDGNRGYAKGRLQVDNVDQPPTQTSDAYQQEDNWDGNDELPIQYQTVESLTSAAHTIDLDASKQSSSITKVAEDRIIFAVQLQLVKPPPAKIKLVQHGTMTLSGSQTVTKTLATSIDTTKSFLTFTSNSDIARPVNVVRCHILNTNTVECVRDSSDTGPVEVRFSVVTYESGIYVQRGTISQSATTNNIALPYGVLSTNNAFVLYSKDADSTDVSWDDNDPIACRLLDTVTVSCQVNGAAAGHQIDWEVVEFLDPDDIFVQSGTTSIASAGNSVYVPLGTPVNTKKTFVLGGFYSSGSGDGGPVGRALMQSRLINENTISFHRGATGNTMNIFYQAVELKDGSTVYRGNQSFPTGTGTKFVNLPVTVDTSLAVAFSGTQTGSGQTQGNSSYTGNDITGVSEYTFGLSTTQINITRRNTVGPADVGWFLIDFRNLLPNFTELTSTANLGTSPGGGSIVFLDANNDGYSDLYMNDDAAGGTTDRLRLNDGDNTFTDDDAETAGDGQGAGGGDYNNDKDVDLIVGNDENLYTNIGSSTFTASGLPDNNHEAIMFADIDGDADLDVWYPGPTYLWARNDLTSTSTGLNNVATHTIRANGGCTNPNNAFTSDNVRTSCDSPSPSTSDVSDYHNLGFAVPAGSVITGVQVNLEHAHNNCPQDTGYWNLKLRNDVGNLIGTNKIGHNYCHDTDETESYGSSIDKWAAILTPAMVNDADFGVAVNYTATGGGGGNNGLIDNIQIRVYYTTSTWVGQTTMPGGATGINNGEGATAADINNDGYLDYLFANTTALNVAYFGNSAHTFTKDVNVNLSPNISGLPNNVGDHENMEWAWGDYDNDGDLDVYISGADSEGLYRNNGAGGFTSVTTAARITIVDPDGASWGDYDNDGYLDLLVAQDGGVSHLYRNNGDGTFT